MLAGITIQKQELIQVAAQDGGGTKQSQND